MASSARPKAGTPQSASRQPSDALQRLQSGTITLDEYLELRAEVALDHVRGKVTADMLETIRVTLKEQLRSDPVLMELVQRATGQIPSPLPEDAI